MSSLCHMDLQNLLLGEVLFFFQAWWLDLPTDLWSGILMPTPPWCQSRGHVDWKKKPGVNIFFSATLTGLTYLLKHISKYSTVPLRLDVQITHHGQSWTEQIWVSSRITRLDEHHQNKLKFGQKFFFLPWQSFPSNFVIWNCAWLCS